MREKELKKKEKKKQTDHPNPFPPRSPTHLSFLLFLRGPKKNQPAHLTPPAR
jgi:hypothetical protein